MELNAGFAVIKDDGHQEVESHRDAQGGCDQNGDGEFVAVSRRKSVAYVRDIVQVRQTSDVEAQVHHLNQPNQCSGANGMRPRNPHHVVIRRTLFRREWDRNFDRNRNGVVTDYLHRRNEAVSTFGLRLNEARVRSGVAQGVAQLIDGGVEAVIEVHESVGGPEALAQILPGDHFASPFKQRDEDLERLLLQTDFAALAEEFAGANVGFVNTEAVAYPIAVGWIDA